MVRLRPSKSSPVANFSQFKHWPMAHILLRRLVTRKSWTWIMLRKCQGEVSVFQHRDMSKCFGKTFRYTPITFVSLQWNLVTSVTQHKKGVWTYIADLSGEKRWLEFCRCVRRHGSKRPTDHRSTALGCSGCTGSLHLHCPPPPKKNFTCDKTTTTIILSKTKHPRTIPLGQNHLRQNAWVFVMGVCRRGGLSYTQSVAYPYTWWT